MDQNGEEVKRWNFHRALPCRWVGPTLDFHSTSVAIDKFEIAYEELWEVDEMSVWSVQATMEDNRHQKYVPITNDCDPWADKILENSIVHSDPLKDPKNRRVSEHQEKMGPGRNIPSEGINLHYKDGHISIVTKEGNTYTVGHQGENISSATTIDTGEITNYYSNVYVYNSKKDFEGSFWGSGIYYPVY